MKHINLLELAGSSFSTKQTSFNPETGKVSWDVEYYPDFSEILQNLDSLIHDLESSIKKHAIKDKEIKTSLTALKSVKSTLLNSLKTNHPEYLKNY